MSDLKIAKPGIDATIATDPRQFLFNSDYNTLKLHSILTSNITVTDALVGSSTIKGVWNTIPFPSDITYLPYYFTSISYSGYVGYNNMYVFNSLEQYLGETYNSISNNTFVPSLAYSPGGTNTISINFIIYVFANPV